MDITILVINYFTYIGLGTITSSYTQICSHNLSISVSNNVYILIYKTIIF